jgi:hypothetical protein
MMEVPNEISENLYPNENVLFCVKKKLRLEAKPKFLAVTDRRVIYLDQKILGRYEIIDVPYEKLEQVFFKEGVVAAEFILKSEDAGTIKLDWMDKKRMSRCDNFNKRRS